MQRRQVGDLVVAQVQADESIEGGQRCVIGNGVGAEVEHAQGGQGFDAGERFDGAARSVEAGQVGDIGTVERVVRSGDGVDGGPADEQGAVQGPIARRQGQQVAALKAQALAFEDLDRPAGAFEGFRGLYIGGGPEKYVEAEVAGAAMSRVWNSPWVWWSMAAARYR